MTALNVRLKEERTQHGQGKAFLKLVNRNKDIFLETSSLKFGVLYCRDYYCN